MDITYLIVVVLLVMILRQDVSWLKELKVRRKLKTWEVIVFILGIGVLITITVLYANKPEHYFAAVVGILFFVIACMSEGISENGILVRESRGIMHCYAWSEIRSAVVEESDRINIKFIDLTGAKITSQSYQKKDYEKLKEIFESNRVLVVNN